MSSSTAAQKYFQGCINYHGLDSATEFLPVDSWKSPTVLGFAQYKGLPELNLLQDRGYVYKYTCFD